MSAPPASAASPRMLLEMRCLSREDSALAEQLSRVDKTLAEVKKEDGRE